MSEYLIRTVILFAFMGSAAWYDYRYRKIPNWLCLAGAAVGLIFLTIAGDGDDWRAAALGCAIAVGAMLLLYLGKGVGGGDVKLMLGLGLLAGYPDIVYLLFFGSIIAVLIIFLNLIWHGQFRKTILREAKKVFFWRPQKTDEEAEKAGMHSVSFAMALALGLCWIQIMEHL